MSAYTLVLGDNYFVYMVAFALAGVVSAFLFTEGELSNATLALGALQVRVWKAVLLALFLFVVWREADDLVDTLVKASFPIGVYKITQTFVSLLIVWRSNRVVELRRDKEIQNG